MDSQTRFELAVQSLLGLGFSSDLVAKGMAARAGMFRILADLPDSPANERVAEVLHRMAPAQKAYASELSRALESDPTGDLEAPTFIVAQNKTFQRFVTAGVAKSFGMKLNFQVAKVRSAIIAIRASEALLMPLTAERADWWRKRVSWKLSEAAALSMGREPPRAKFPQLPQSCEINELRLELKERLDQLGRARRLTKRNGGLSGDYVTPDEFFSYVRSKRPFAIDRAIQPPAHARVYRHSRFHPV